MNFDLVDYNYLFDCFGGVMVNGWVKKDSVS